MFAVAPLLDSGEGAARIFMATPGAVLEIGHRVQDFRAIHFFVRIGLELARMAAGAIGLVTAVLPSDHFIIGFVASGTGHARVMRLIVGRCMRIASCRCPAGGAMAGFASARGDEVPPALTCGSRSIMASGTSGRDPCVTHLGTSETGSGLMASLARGGGQNM